MYELYDDQRRIPQDLNLRNKLRISKFTTRDSVGRGQPYDFIAMHPTLQHAQVALCRHLLVCWSFSWCSIASTHANKPAIQPIGSYWLISRASNSSDPTHEFFQPGQKWCKKHSRHGTLAMQWLLTAALLQFKGDLTAFYCRLFEPSRCKRQWRNV